MVSSANSPHLGLQAGSVVAGKYRIVRELGSGGAGTVFAALHLQLGELVALKFLNAPVSIDRGDASRLLREAQSAARLKNEHVARILDVATTEEGEPYLVMEYLDGRDLGELLNAEGPISLPAAVDFLMHVCEGLAEAHAVGIIHRDLKPSNFFLTRRTDGSPLVKVLDFGIAKGVERAEISLTQTRTMLGSPVYMSPEQLRSARNVDHRSDIWSLGISLYELLTDTLPFEGETVTGVAAAVTSDPVRPLRQYCPSAPDGLVTAIERCLEKRPADRFQSIGELAEALAPFGSGEAAISLHRIRGTSGQRSSSTEFAAKITTHGHGSATPATARTLVSSSTDSFQPQPGRSRFVVSIAIAAGLGAILAISFLSFRDRWSGSSVIAEATASGTLAGSSAAVPRVDAAQAETAAANASTGGPSPSSPGATIPAADTSVPAKPVRFDGTRTRARNAVAAAPSAVPPSGGPTALPAGAQPPAATSPSFDPARDTRQ